MSSSRFDPIETYDPGDTVMFTWQASVAPDSAPLFTVFDQASTVVMSLTATQSGSTQYFALFTMPSTGPTHYVAEFRALKTVAGSSFPFIERDAFRVRATKPTG